MKELRTEIRIAANPDAVWRAMTENEDWGSWNPFVRRVEGRLAAGERLRNTLALPGSKPMTFEPRVLAAEPGCELRWLGRLWVPRLFDGEHYFLLEDADEGGTRFVQGEIFRGLLVGILNRAKTEQAFRSLNEGLKRKVEGRSAGV